MSALRLHPPLSQSPPRSGHSSLSKRDSGPRRIPTATLTCETSFCRNLVRLLSPRCLWAPPKGLSLPLCLAHCNREILPIERLWVQAQDTALGDLFSHVENKNSFKSWFFPRGVLRAPVSGAGQPQFKSHMLALTSLIRGPLGGSCLLQGITAGDQVCPTWPWRKKGSRCPGARLTSPHQPRITTC